MGTMDMCRRRGCCQLPAPIGGAGVGPTLPPLGAQQPCVLPAHIHYSHFLFINGILQYVLTFTFKMSKLSRNFHSGTGVTMFSWNLGNSLSTLSMIFGVSSPDSKALRDLCFIYCASASLVMRFR